MSTPRLAGVMVLQVLAYILAPPSLFALLLPWIRSFVFRRNVSTRQFSWVCLHKTTRFCSATHSPSKSLLRQEISHRLLLLIPFFSFKHPSQQIFHVVSFDLWDFHSPTRRKPRRPNIIPIIEEVGRTLNHVLIAQKTTHVFRQADSITTSSEFSSSAVVHDIYMKL